MWWTLLATLMISLAARAVPAGGPAPLDGVEIESIETYQNPRSQHLDFGLGLWPMNAYYNAFSLDVGYTRYFNKSSAWEVLRLNYFYTVDKSLTTDLAQNYNVNPVQIERLKFALSSDYVFVNAYGKMIFAQNYIRYFRSAFTAGPAYLKTNQEATVGLGASWRVEVISTEALSWTFELRDVYAFHSIGDNISISLGTSYGF